MRRIPALDALRGVAMDEDGGWWRVLTAGALTALFAVFVWNAWRFPTNGGHDGRRLLLLVAGCVGFATLYMSVRHPSPDGDTVKASFWLVAMAPIGALAAVAVDRWRWALVPVGLWAVTSLPFLFGVHA
jgi:hypothetical protein